jgi:hypothetical protein
MLRLRAEAAAPGETHQIVTEFQDPYLELVRLLREASEIEHALLVQYLFAGFSLKPRYQGLAGGGFPSAGSTFLSVAVQEMSHLDAVNELLMLLGASSVAVTSRIYGDHCAKGKGKALSTGGNGQLRRESWGAPAGPLAADT